MITLADLQIGVILLAAGRGSRMRGEAASKLLLPMPDGQPILRHAALGALALDPVEMVVVVRPDLPELIHPMSGLQVRCVRNPRYMEGMGTSLAAGVAVLSADTEAVIVMLGDEPVVPVSVVEALVAAYRREAKPITTPVYGSEPGPPTLFSRSLYPDLIGLEGDTGGRQLIARYPDFVTRVQLSARNRPHDIDTPEDYKSIAPQQEPGT